MLADRLVRGTAVGDTDRRVGWTPDIDTRMARLESPVRDVLEPTLESAGASALDADRITIVPDCHYPFHPSTGMVTDPAIVGTIVSWLEERTDAAVAVAGATDEFIDLERTAQYLGYETLLERFDAELVDLADETEPRTETTLTVGGRSVALSLPTRLLEDPVLTVPTLRPTETGAIAGGMRQLATVADTAADPDAAAVATTRAVDPVGSLMDATIAYGSDPYAADALFAGSTPAVDAIGSSLLERSIEADDALRATVGPDAPDATGPDATDPAPVTLECVGSGADDLDIATIRSRLGGGELPPSDGTHPAVTAAYRLYATVGGDAVPPQLEQGP